MSNSPLMSKTNIASISLLVISSIALAVWLMDRSRFVHISDARIAATMISVSSRNPGWIADFPVKDGMVINSQDILVEIDNRDTHHKLNQLEARIRTVDAEYSRQQSRYALNKKRIEATIEAEASRFNGANSATQQAQISFSQAKRDFVRAESLLEQKMISEAGFDARKSDVERIEQSYQQKIADAVTAKAQLSLSENSRTELDVIKMDLEIIASRRDELLSQRNRLITQIEDHTIRSKIHGVVDETFANAGEYVYPGQRILMLHNPEKIWIKAYVKETEVQYLALDSEVDIEIDAYPDSPLHGVVSNIGNAATSQFAMLPSPNPSGNFVKVTQRIEVQIQFDSEDLNLKPGMMVELKIKKFRG